MVKNKNGCSEKLKITRDMSERNDEYFGTS